MRAQHLKNYIERDKTFSIHHENIQALAIEIYKFINGLSRKIMNSVFHLKENNRYSLWNVYDLYSPEIWSIVLQTIKEHCEKYRNFI